MNAEVGQAVAFAGPLKHAGYPTTKGVRVILVLFLYVERYHYGPYLNQAKSQCVTPMSTVSELYFASLVTIVVFLQQARNCNRLRTWSIFVKNLMCSYFVSPIH